MIDTEAGLGSASPNSASMAAAIDKLVCFGEDRCRLGELESLPLLTGFRGKAAGDVDALANAIVSLSQLADRPEIAELEINPLMVIAGGRRLVRIDT